MIIKVVTLGCKVNQYESGAIVAALKKIGYNASEGLESADVYIINTCSVTAEADRKSRQYVGKMRKLNRDCDIIVLGCSAENKPESFKLDNVVAVGGTEDKTNFAINEVNSLLNTPKYSILPDRILYLGADLCDECGHMPIPVFDRTRAYVKIQDGCNRFCTYCIIPYLRGRCVSRSIDDIVSECEQIGSHEIVLTGIDISAYGTDNGTTLPELLTSLSGIRARKRIGSLECEAVTDELLCAMRDCGFCPHFHLSLQSGDDDVLKSMNRRYDCEYYYEKIALIREYFPLAGITTDIIAGFPTETDERFENSCEFIKKCEFSDIHVFPYSARAGTLAARKYSALPPETLKRRVGVLLGIKTELHDRFISKNLGAVASVYTESREGRYNVGYTPNYIKVYSDAPCGEITDLRLVSQYDSGILGELKNNDYLRKVERSND